MVKYLSGRVKRTPQDQLKDDRYQYLNLEQAEPNLADPPTPTSEIPPGSQFQLVSIPGHPGRRYWVPIGGGLTQGSITIFDEGSQVSGTSSITQLNFVGAAVTAVASVQSPSGHPGIAATVTVIPVTISDNPPIGAGTTNNGELWWESDTGDLYVYYDDGNTSQWVQANAGGRGLAGNKGDKGEPSTQQGPEGDKGSEGEKGAPGNVLAKGVKGDPGVDGSDGSDGSDGDKGNTGNKGEPGVEGDKGEQGIKGQKGEVGVQGDKAGILYEFSNANTMVDPNAGNFRFNSSTLSSVSQIAIDALDKNGNDFSDFITTWDDSTDNIKGILSIKSNDNSDTSHTIFQVSSITDNTGFLIIGVQNGVGNIPSNLETCVLNFSRTGEKGASGDKGVTDKIIEGNTEAEVVDTGTNGHFKVTTEGQERLRIGSDGKVGINSISPNKQLDVIGDSGMLVASTTNGGLSDNGISIFLSDNRNSTTSDLSQLGEINYKHTDVQTPEDSYSDVFTFKSTETDLAVNVEGTLLVDKTSNANSGRVGIGTSVPQRSLHIQSTGDALARITSADGNASLLELGDVSDPDGGKIVYDNGSNLEFYTESLPRLRIKSGGNVGINSTNPGQRLSVVGSIRALDNNSNAFVQLTSDGSIELKRSDGGFIDFATAGTEDHDCRIRQESNGLTFKTGGSGSATEKFRFGSSGQLGLAGANYGNPGQVLTSQGSGSSPTWTTPIVNTNTTYDLGTADGDNTAEEKIQLTGSDLTTDTVILAVGSGLSIQRDSSTNKITLTNTDTGSGSNTFIGLTDTPSSFTAGKILKVNGAGNAVIFADDQNTTYAISVVDGDSSNQEKIRLTASNPSSTDDIVLEAGTGLSIAKSGDKITFTNTDTGSGSEVNIINNADNRIITGSNTANTLNAESTLTYDGSVFKINGTGQALLTLRTTSNTSDRGIAFQNSGNAYVASINVEDAGSDSGDLVFHVDNTNNTDLSLVEERFRIKTSGAFGLNGANYGTSGQVLTSQGSSSAPIWSTPGDNNTTYTLPAGGTNSTSFGTGNATITLRDSSNNNDTVTITAGTNIKIENTGADGFKISAQDTNTNTNTTYQLLATRESDGGNSGNDTNPYLFLNASGTGTDDSVRLVGSGSVTVEKDNDGQITISGTDTNTDTNTTYDLSVPSGTTAIRLDPSDASGNDDVEIAAGTNITVTRDNGNKLTIASSATLTGSIDNADNIKISTATGNEFKNITFVDRSATNNSYNSLKIDSQDDVLAYNPSANKLRTTNLRVNRIYTSGDSPGSSGQLLTSGGTGNFTWTDASNVGTNSYVTNASFSSITGGARLTLNRNNGLSNIIADLTVTTLGVEKFTDLSDTPNNYTNDSNKLVAVNSGETALTFINASSLGTNVSTSSNPPGSPSDGDLWWDTDDGDLHIYYDDGSGNPSAQWVSIGASGQKGEKGAQGQSGTMIVNARTSGYTAVSSDNGKLITMTSGNLTINSNVFSAGDAVSVANLSNSALSIVQGSGVTLYLTGTTVTGNRSLAAKGLCSLVCVSTNTFFVSGGGVT